MGTKIPGCRDLVVGGRVHFCFPLQSFTSLLESFSNEILDLKVPLSLVSFSSGGERRKTRLPLLRRLTSLKSLSTEMLELCIPLERDMMTSPEWRGCGFLLSPPRMKPPSLVSFRSLTTAVTTTGRGQKHPFPTHWVSLSWGPGSHGLPFTHR